MYVLRALARDLDPQIKLTQTFSRVWAPLRITMLVEINDFTGTVTMSHTSEATKSLMRYKQE